MRSNRLSFEDEKTQMFTNRILKITVMAFGLLAASGCSSQLQTYPVSGIVEFENGRPVVVGTVELLSVEHSINARGNIQPDGTFKLTTFTPNDGAVAGRHKCVVLQMVIGEDIKGHSASTIGVVDRRYAAYESSGLEVEIKPEQNDVKLVVRGIKKQPKPGESHSH